MNRRTIILVAIFAAVATFGFGLTRVARAERLASVYGSNGRYEIGQIVKCKISGCGDFFVESDFAGKTFAAKDGIVDVGPVTKLGTYSVRIFKSQNNAPIVVMIFFFKSDGSALILDNFLSATSAVEPGTDSQSAIAASVAARATDKLQADEARWKKLADSGLNRLGGAMKKTLPDWAVENLSKIGGSAAEGVACLGTKYVPVCALWMDTNKELLLSFIEASLIEIVEEMEADGEISSSEAKLAKDYIYKGRAFFGITSEKNQIKRLLESAKTAAEYGCRTVSKEQRGVCRILNSNVFDSVEKTIDLIGIYGK